MSNILQSDIWARFQESNGHTVIRKSGNGWSYLATVEGGATGRYLYSPYGKSLPGSRLMVVTAPRIASLPLPAKWRMVLNTMVSPLRIMR